MFKASEIIEKKFSGASRACTAWNIRSCGGLGLRLRVRLSLSQSARLGSADKYITCLAIFSDAETPPPPGLAKHNAILASQ